MQGAVFGTIIVAIVVVLLAGITPFLLIPIVVLGLAALAAIPLIGASRNSRLGPHGAGPSGVPSTSEAAYDPVQDPAHRPG